MKQKRLAELRTLTTSEDFSQWWKDLTDSRNGLADAEASYEELLGQSTLMEFRAELTQKNAIDTLYRAGEHEDSAANMLFESTDLENRSFKGVGDFEEQRIRASEAWYRLGAAEKQLDESKDAKRPADVISALERAARYCSDEYEKENARKARLWDEVERQWARSTEVSLLLSEQKALGKKVRRQAEEQFGLAEERKQKSKKLKVETENAAKSVEAAKARVSALMEQARERFGCAAGTDFLFFRNKDDQRLAWALSLVSDRDGYNIEVKSLALYQVDLKRGVGFLEPARQAPVSAEEGDRRFEEYFLKGRKGELRVS
ncbi:MAG: hypothetical protein QM723_17810 [Myxococcaceae bacterium]